MMGALNILEEVERRLNCDSAQQNSFIKVLLEKAMDRALLIGSQDEPFDQDYPTAIHQIWVPILVAGPSTITMYRKARTIAFSYRQEQVVSSLGHSPQNRNY